MLNMGVRSFGSGVSHRVLTPRLCHLGPSPGVALFCVLFVYVHIFVYEVGEFGFYSFPRIQEGLVHC